MSKTSKAELIKKLLQHQGDDPEEVELIHKMQKLEEAKELWIEIRSWIAVLISFFALLISIFVFLRK